MGADSISGCLAWMLVACLLRLISPWHTTLDACVFDLLIRPVLSGVLFDGGCSSLVHCLHSCHGSAVEQEGDLDDVQD